MREGKRERERSERKFGNLRRTSAIDRVEFSKFARTRRTEMASSGPREHRFLFELNTVNRPKLLGTVCKGERKIENTN